MSTIYETKKVSQLDEAASASGADFVPVVQSGVTKRVSMENIVVGRSTESDHATAADDADTVGGKALASPISPNTGLSGAWGPGLPKWPDNPSGTTYFQDAWATTDSWSLSNAVAGAPTVSNGVLTADMTRSGGGASILARNVSFSASSYKTWKVRIRGTITNIRPKYNNGTEYDITGTSIPVTSSWAIVDIPIAGDANWTGTINRIQFNSDSDGTFEIDWLYIGDGTYSTKLPDLSGNGNHGTVYGATPDADGSLSFDGVNDYVTTQVGSYFGLDKIVTFSAWVRILSSEAIQFISYPDGANNNRFYLQVVNATSIFFVANSGTTITIPLNTNELAHIVTIRDNIAGTMTAYKNGVFIETKSTTKPTSVGATPLFIGDLNGSSAFCNCIIRSPRIYNRALSEQEIWDLYAQDGKHELNQQIQAVTPVPNSLVVRDATGVTEFSGIRFPATQVADAGANVLDDYEEGTFTPAITFGGGNTGITYNASSTGGTYTKIGKKVFYNLVVVLTSKGSSTGVIRITGLPFASPNIVTGSSPGSPMVNVVTFSGIVIYSVLQNTSQISIAQCTTAGVYSELTDTSFANNSVIRVAGHYDT